MLAADPAGQILDPADAPRLDDGAGDPADRRRRHAHQHAAVRSRHDGDDALRRRQHAAAARPVDGAPDRVHVGHPGRDAGRAAPDLRLHLRGRAGDRRGGEAAGANTVEFTPRAPARTRSSTTSRTSSTSRSAPRSRPAPTTARRGVEAVAGRSRREGDLRVGRDGEPRHRRRRRQRRRRLPGGPQAHRRRAHGARAALRARRRAVPRPDPAHDAVGPQLARTPPARRAAAADRARTDERSRTAASRRGARRSAARTRSSPRPSPSPGTPYRLSYSSGWEPGAAGPQVRRPDHARDAARGPRRRRAPGRDRGSEDHPALRRPGALPTRLRRSRRSRRTSSSTWPGTASTPRAAGRRVRPSRTSRWTTTTRAVLPGRGRFGCRQFAQIPRRPGRRSSPRRASAAATGAARGRLGRSLRLQDRSEETRAVGRSGRTQVGLGSWDLDAHHVYDPLAGEVQLGDGTVRRGGEVDLGRLRTVGGPGRPGLVRRRDRRRPPRRAARRIDPRRQRDGDLSCRRRARRGVAASRATAPPSRPGSATAARTRAQPLLHDATAVRPDGGVVIAMTDQTDPGRAAASAR